MLTFIEKSDLKFEVKKVIESAINDSKARDIHKRVIDPFGALFDAHINKNTSSKWLEKETSRQNQKSLQQHVGDMHENIISKLKGGWEKFDGILDVKNDKMKIVAEIKNKYNTTKGNHQKNIYDDLLSIIETDGYKNHTGYYVVIIPKTPLPFNIPFTPSDNKTRLNRPENNKIRQIDGRSFYAIATGVQSALMDLYHELPRVIEEVFKDLSISYISDLDKDNFFNLLMKKAYGDD